MAVVLRAVERAHPAGSVRIRHAWSKRWDSVHRRVPDIPKPMMAYLKPSD